MPYWFFMFHLLEKRIADAFAAAGLPGDDAARCAALMTEADLTGADGHGIFRLPQYVRRLKAGGFNKRPQITVKKTGPATALVEAMSEISAPLRQKVQRAPAGVVFTEICCVVPSKMEAQPPSRTSASGSRATSPATIA